MSEQHRRRTRLSHSLQESIMTKQQREKVQPRVTREKRPLVVSSTNITEEWSQSRKVEILKRNQRWG